MDEGQRKLFIEVVEGIGSLMNGMEELGYTCRENGDEKGADEIAALVLRGQQLYQEQAQFFGLNTGHQFGSGED